MPARVGRRARRLPQPDTCLLLADPRDTCERGPVNHRDIPRAADVARRTEVGRKPGRPLRLRRLRPPVARACRAAHVGVGSRYEPAALEPQLALQRDDRRQIRRHGVGRRVAAREMKHAQPRQSPAEGSELLGQVLTDVLRVGGESASSQRRRHEHAVRHPGGAHRPQRRDTPTNAQAEFLSMVIAACDAPDRQAAAARW